MGKNSDSKSASKLSAARLRFGIVISRFNGRITERLLKGAIEALKAAGASDRQIEVIEVPGAFEIPLAAKKNCRGEARRRAYCHRLRSARRDGPLQLRLLRSRAWSPTRAA